jgi:transcriptional antiterminator NusG
MKVMGFSEQEEQALNSSEDSESGKLDSESAEIELADKEIDSGAGDEAALESEDSPAESELLDSDPDSPLDVGEEPELEKPTEEDLEAADSDDLEMDIESAGQELIEPEEPAEEQIEEPEVEGVLVEGEAALEQEQIETEELRDTSPSDAEVEIAEEKIAESEVDNALIEEGAAALISEMNAEKSTPVLKPETSLEDEDTFDVSLDFLDQDPNAIEDEEGRSWFVVHCYSGYENKVRHNLEQRIETMGMKDKIFDIVVPTEEEIEVREGKRRTVERRVFPGYILVNMVMTEESWYVVRNTPGVTGFVGMGNNPTPLRPEEVSQIIKRMEAEAPRIKVTFKAGERVRIVDGPFNDFRGTVSEIDMERAKVRVMVNFFGRDTPVELDFLQVEKT